MSEVAPIDLSACRHWRPSQAFGAAHVGIIPEWNAVTLLNPAAATIWDLLIETRDAGACAAAYARRIPERAVAAAADVEACLAAWSGQGLFRMPEPSEEERHLALIADRPARTIDTPALRRAISVAGVPTLLEIEAPALAEVVSDLIADFPDAPAPADRTLQISGPDGGWVLSLDGRPARVAPNLVFARGLCVAELVRIAAGAAGWRATIHGAVLSGPSGAVFLAGASGAGKSTLSAGLVSLGWKILAEDIAAFDDRWRVCPMPFALSIKEGAVDALRTAFPDLADARVHTLGPRRVRYQSVPPNRRGATPERPRMVFEVSYEAAMGTGPAVLEPLTPLETLGLFMNEESFIDFERDGTDTFLAFVEETPGYRVRFGDIAAAERGIRDCLEGHENGRAR